MRPLATIVFAAAVALWSSGEAQSQENDAKKPNIVFIFTDDQDYHHSSLDYMQNLQKELVAKGTEFTNHYATISVCCPSRVSLMRGQLAHNTNNTHVRAPGCVILIITSLGLQTIIWASLSHSSVADNAPEVDIPSSSRRLRTMIIFHSG